MHYFFDVQEEWEIWISRLQSIFVSVKKYFRRKIKTSIIDPQQSQRYSSCYEKNILPREMHKSLPHANGSLSAPLYENTGSYT